MAVATCLRHGQTIAAALGTCMLADLALARASRRRILATKRSTSSRQGRIPSDLDAPARWGEPKERPSSSAGRGDLCSGSRSAGLRCHVIP